MPADLKSIIADLVSGLEPAKPATQSPHLVSYFLLVDRPARSVLLCDHRLAALWLPTGGHVEPGEHPLDTVRTCCAPWPSSAWTAPRSNAEPPLANAEPPPGNTPKAGAPAALCRTRVV